MPEAKTYRQINIHTEDVVQQHVMQRLIALQGYEVRSCGAGHLDAKWALDPEMLFAFLEETQPDVLTQLESSYPGRGEQTLLDELDRNLKEHGTLHVLRKGIDIIPNIRVQVCALKPASEINQTLIARYLKNRLSVMEEVRYSAKESNKNRIDLVLFVNGIPVVTMELKNVNTGSNFRDAERQYQKDRRPAGEPLLEPGRGALVHMAVDQNFVSMTTELRNGKTRFLPFNRGRDGRAGNPDRADGEWRTAYLYADEPGLTAVFSREVLLEIIGKFMHLDGGRLIFPRFQQLDAVRKIVADAREHGAGCNYLVQHSAGSGKSLTIAWTAHRLATLHNAADEAVFDSVIIVTDRVVLDRQLQDTVTGLGGPRDYVKPIKGTSRDLREALDKGAKIVVTTIQKFSTDHLKTLSGLSNRRFAVIVDEAHGSQSGKHADNLAGALSQDELTGEESVGDMIARFQESRGPAPNVSYLAFTATPRNVTLERFGRISPDTGMPEPFHLYSMRQAIDEGFILNVLENYSTYKAYHELEKSIEDDPAFEGRQGARRVAKFVTLNPTQIAQKVEVIVEHFRRHVMHLMEGQAKAMVVTGSREHAYRYYVEVNRFLQNAGYSDIKPLVAFSGDLEIDGETVSEAQLNGFRETELPDRFDTNKYQLLIVAEKYQTGFDQPKLCAMYVDRKLSGLQAVQTLSRLNRTHPEKHKTFVLDFQNTIDDIREAFKPWFETTELEDRTNPDQVYDLRKKILASGFIAEAEIDGYVGRFFRPKLQVRDRLVLEGFVRPAVERFEAAEEDEQEPFRQLLNSYRRFYSFVAQIFPVRDDRLEKLYAYVDMLAKMLPGRERPAEVEITSEMIRLVRTEVDELEQGSATPEEGDRKPLAPITEFGDSSYTEPELKALSEIIAAFNERHGTDFSEQSFLRYERCNQEVLADDDKVEMIRNNARNVVDRQYKKWFKRAMIQMYKEDKEVQDILMQDATVQNQIIEFFLTGQYVRCTVGRQAHQMMRGARLARKLPRKSAVRELVVKASESATLAVEVYNKPTVEFRTGAYCTLMIIAWTALLHSVFERDGIKYFYKQKNGRYLRRDGDRVAWEVSTCLKRYWRGDLDNPIAKNLELFVRLRNKIEHRSMRSVDAHLMPEAQALLLNFKTVLQMEFGIELLGDIGLYIPISVFSSKRTIPQSTEERSVLEFIDKYRESLDASMWDDTKYAFRAYLVPKIGNHESSSDVTIEFIKSSELDEKGKRQLGRITSLIKSKQAAFDANLMKPRAVVAEVRKRFPKFNMHQFVNAWKKLRVRPPGGAEDPGKTDTRFCYFDPVDADYRYEPTFVDHLCEHLANGETFTDPGTLTANGQGDE